MLIGCCFAVIGVTLGVVFTLFFITFDKSWKKILSSLCCVGGSGGTIYGLHSYFGIQSQDKQLISTIMLFLAFLVTFFIALAIMCWLIKDKDDKDVLRIRDILLGQKSYIDKYYEKRQREIDQRLNIELLEERERKIQQKENSISIQKKFIDCEFEKLEKLGERKLRIYLPQNTNIVISKQLLDTIPSYMGDFAKCINDMKLETDNFVANQAKWNMGALRAYLLSVSMIISQHIFGGSSGVRIHFRAYNNDTKRFEKLLAIIGNTVSNKSMTPIPYEGSMIKRSFECKRALIKSINSEDDFQSNNYTTWKDYMTFTFYNLQRDNIPYFSFGISVKSDSRYRDLFYFLSFVGLETYLNEYIELIDSKYGIEDVLYSGEKQL